jgi:opacity protein-like surface antigen
MTIIRLSGAAGLLLLASTASVLAADSLPGAAFSGPAPETIEAPSVISSEAPADGAVGTGWYLRGDIGYGMGDIALEGDIGVPYVVEGQDSDGNTITWTERSKTRLTDADRGNFFMGGLGFGYDFGWIRTDLTVDMSSKSKVEASRRGTDSLRVSGDYRCETDAACIAEEQAKLSTLTTFLNVYADLGNWNGISPYVGAGVGAAYVDWSEHKTSETCRSLTGGCVPGYPDEATSIDPLSRTWRQDDSSNWRLAWALMAGVSYNLDENLALDLGYRYTRITDGNVVSNVRGTAGLGIGSIDYEDLENHEIRAGLRYTLPSD